MGFKLSVSRSAEIGAGIQVLIDPGAVAFFVPVVQEIAAAGYQFQRSVGVFPVDGGVFLIVVEIHTVIVRGVLRSHGLKICFQVRARIGRIVPLVEFVGAVVFQDGGGIGHVGDLVAFLRAGGVGDLVAPQELAGVVISL